LSLCNPIVASATIRIFPTAYCRRDHIQRRLALQRRWNIARKKSKKGIDKIAAVCYTRDNESKQANQKETKKEVHMVHMVNAEGYILDASGEVASISTSGALPVVIDMLEYFFSRYKEMPAAAEWRGAYIVEFDGVVVKQSHRVPLDQINRVVI